MSTTALPNETGCYEKMYGSKMEPLSSAVPVTITLVIIFTTGLAGNINTCLVISRNRAMHTATNYYLFSLAISDLLFLLFGLPFEIHYMWHRYPFLFGDYFLLYQHLPLKDIWRFVILFLAHTISNLSRTVKIIFFIWVLAIVSAIPPTIYFKILTPNECPVCGVEAAVGDIFAISSFLIFIIPMGLITVLYILIGLKLKSAQSIRTNDRTNNKSLKKVINMLGKCLKSYYMVHSCELSMWRGPTTGRYSANLTNADLSMSVCRPRFNDDSTDQVGGSDDGRHIDDIDTANTPFNTPSPTSFGIDIELIKNCYHAIAMDVIEIELIACQLILSNR
ncbi:hypothetical protein NQ317_018512 [Molorchus minor]|uniref:G-protein coupled receptors family 1 profile domain-containing protein n=1 Tax=Molorchus minor TaxID=1323400 RepID=A0ABQ9J984_9CUCU|nr:hypothetical protein NQ317_018512 [Molorchus minor]